MPAALSHLKCQQEALGGGFALGDIAGGLI